MAVLVVVDNVHDVGEAGLDVVGGVAGVDNVGDVVNVDNVGSVFQG